MVPNSVFPDTPWKPQNLQKARLQFSVKNMCQLGRVVAAAAVIELDAKYREIGFS